MATIRSRSNSALTRSRLMEALTYCPATGVFRWRISLHGHGGAIEPGDVAGKCCDGYRVIGIDGGRYLAHRLAWLYMTGEWPSAFVDHRSLDRSDNRWENLRLATHTQNQANKHCRSDSFIGLKGVRRCRGRWQARIKIDGIEKHLGTFDSPERAHAAYLRAAVHAFGEFARAT